MLQTERLLLRPFQEADAPHFFALNNDPEVVRYTGDDPFPDEAAAREFLRNYDPYFRFGYGRLAVLERSTGDYLGWCGLKYDPDLAETDLGFRFKRSAWNRGFATEAALVCLQQGFTEFDLDLIVGRVMADNKASIRVLEKVGMTFWKPFEFARHPGLYYRLFREDWASTKS
ncbi:MAG: GNAT family N-acetyltransferase [Lewinellaceae bacterium]|nr:GNAT family N-acetyltransferase [Lewinellaceae bacterium]